MREKCKIIFRYCCLLIINTTLFLFRNYGKLQNYLGWHVVLTFLPNLTDKDFHDYDTVLGHKHTSKRLIMDLIIRAWF